MPNLPKVIFVVGPTASGKTALGLFLAQKFNGEIINADSRQIYKEMNIGTAKPPRDVGFERSKVFVSSGVVHHLMDIIKPSEIFTLSDFKNQTQKVIVDIIARGKLPIVVGGTGLYVWSLIDNLDIPKVAPNKKLRESFEKKSLVDLVKLLKNTDPEAYNKIDIKNKRRVLRALEVSLSTGESFTKQTTKSSQLYNALQIGVACDRDVLYKKINDRIDDQVERGVVEETKKLSKKFPFSLPSMSSLGYKQIAQFLKGEITKVEMLELFKRDTRHYAKRQISWFKRDKRILWINPQEKNKIEELVQKFIAE